MALTTVLVGYDLSASAELALARAIAIAGQHGAKVVLVHAQASDAAGAPHADDAPALAQLGEVAAAIRDEEARRLADKLAELRALGVAVELVSEVGPPDDVLAAAAHDEASDLIVVGTHGHTGVSRFLLGSVAATVLRRAPCDVLVVRGPATRDVFHRPLVATDFSPAAARAVARTDNVVAPGSALGLVHAWELPAGSWGATLLGQARFPWSTVRDAVLGSAQRQAEQLTAAHGGAWHVALEQGAPASVITHAAERDGHDLIVVGSHGHRGFRRLLLGSVAESTVRHAPCSVLVVHGAPS
ncbi:MAG TPA: universal stress protein [Kofleriaceae bacterium]|nr:universal stress protein [Kofleriaceae bacterium]